MSGKIYPVEAKDMTKNQLKKAKKHERREQERISNISEEYPQGFTGVHPCVNSCTKCGCAATTCGCGIAAACTGGCTAFGGGRRTRRRKRGGGYTFTKRRIGGEWYSLRTDDDGDVIHDDGKIKLYDYHRVVSDEAQGKNEAWFDTPYNPEGKGGHEGSGGAFIRMDNIGNIEKKGGRTRRRKRKRRRKSTKKKRRRKRTKKKRRRTKKKRRRRR
jgi:hypothetical protein